MNKRHLASAADIAILRLPIFSHNMIYLNLSSVVQKILSISEVIIYNIAPWPWFVSADVRRQSPRRGPRHPAQSPVSSPVLSPVSELTEGTAVYYVLVF